MSKIEIYTNESCPYCKQVKERFKSENIEFVDKDTSVFTEEYQQIVNLTGIPTIPTVKYKEQCFVPGRDFQNPENLINIVKNYKKSNYSEEKIISERIKTLNYNINGAFSKLDQLLRKIETNTKKDETL
tara:strand:- start:38 stop:424 length:387 start_codon:yes stop_codon:yes gene_type:complete